jgi:uncharacterized protein (DUF433 family)
MDREQPILIFFSNSGRILPVALTNASLSANEAALVTGVPLKQVHRMVDAGLLQGAAGNRAGVRIIRGGRALVGLMLAHQTADLLTPEGRRRLLNQLLRRPKATKLEESALTVDVRPIESAIRARLNALARAKKVVSIDRDILNGTPCFKGTRIPVHDIAAMIGNGDEKSAVLKAYPQLSPELIDLAILYAEAYPRRGRPRCKPFWRKNKPLSSERVSVRDLPRAS